MSTINGRGIFAGGGGGVIKSVQRGIHNIGASAQETLITINEVDPENTVAYMTEWASWNSDGVGSTYMQAGIKPYVELTDSTTLSIKRTITSADTNTYVPYEVVEFDNVKKIQKGVVEFRENSEQLLDVPVEEVDPNKTMLFADWIMNAAGDSNGNGPSQRIGHQVASITLTNSTTLSLKKAKAQGGMYGNSGGYMQYQLVEFK